MPFDALPVHQRSLADTIARCGITPIPMAELRAYKAEQLTKHPASRLFPYVQMLRWGFLTLCVGCLVWLSKFHGGEWVWPLSGLIGLLGLIFADKVRFKGPAYWTEYHIYDNHRSVPPDIQRLAEQVVSDLPSASIVIGILAQNRIVLDPYLVATYGDERVCLGIWDENRIIRIAEAY